MLGPGHGAFFVPTGTETKTGTEKEITNMASIHEALNKAKVNATTAVATVQTSDNAVAMRPAAQRFTLDDLTGGSLDVDEFIKVKEFGLQIGSDASLFEEIIVDININEVQVNETIKYGKNPTIYLKTLDGVNCLQGGTWEVALQKASAAEPGVRPYRSADIPMTLVEDLVYKGKTVAEAGTRLGHSTSTTNRANLQSFLAEVNRQGYSQEQVRVRLSAEVRKSKGNSWGVMKFELLGLSSEMDN